MMWVDLFKYINDEIEACENAKRDWNIDADKWEWRRKAFVDMKKRIGK